MPSTIRGDSGFDTDLPFVTEQGSNDKGHYRKWSNGFIEQWITGAASTGGSVNEYPVPFVTGDVSCVLTSRSAAAFSVVASTGTPGLTSVTVYAGGRKPSHGLY